MPASTGLTHVSTVRGRVPCGAGSFLTAAFTSVAIGCCHQEHLGSLPCGLLSLGSLAWAHSQAVIRDTDAVRQQDPGNKGFSRPRRAPCMLMSLWLKQVTGQPRMRSGLHLLARESAPARCEGMGAEAEELRTDEYNCCNVKRIPSLH